LRHEAEGQVDLAVLDMKQHWHQRYHSDPGHDWPRRTVAELTTGLMRRKKT